MKKKVFCNWKMFLGMGESYSLAKAIVEKYGRTHTGLAIFPSFEALSSVAGMLKGTEILLGAQDSAITRSGAYTGEVSPDNLKAIGCQYVLVGHSDRRALGDTDMVVAARMKVALEVGLTPVLCVGETQQERDAGKTHDVVLRQIESASAGVQASDYLISYEPVWAIGTGCPATADDASAMCSFIKKMIVGVMTLYGGSVDQATAAQYSAYDSIDGFLVGSASMHERTLFPLLDELQK